MVAQALIASGEDVKEFQRSLAWRLRFWLLGLPAGVGLATLRAAMKLWLGFGPERSGVRSAGNGPAMRAMILGAAVDDDRKLTDLVRASTRITHTDPRAEQGALAVALATRMACEEGRPDGATFLDRLSTLLGDADSDLLRALGGAARSAVEAETTRAFADSIGQAEGVSGFINHTVPVAIHAWLRHPRDLRSAVTAVVECGGDTDTTGAIVGGIVGAGAGEAGIPGDWLDQLMEWPRSVRWMRRLARQVQLAMETGDAQPPIRLFLPGLIVRNAIFLAVVLIHGLRRALPPY